MDKERIIQEFVPGKQVTLAHLIAHPGEELAKKIGVPDAGAIGIMTLTPGETAMIAGDLALKAAGVHIGFLDRFTDDGDLPFADANIQQPGRQPTFRVIRAVDIDQHVHIL